MVLNGRARLSHGQQCNGNISYMLNVGYSNFAGQYDPLKSNKLSVIRDTDLLSGWYHSVESVPQGLSWLPWDESVFEDDLISYCEPTLSAHSIHG
jgi:hypothetical protein